MKTILKDKKRVLIGEAISEKYTFSYYMNVNKNIKAVFMPENTKEVSKIVKYCNENNIVFIPIATATGAVGGQYGIDDNVVLIDLSLMNNVIGFDEESLTVTVEAGVSLGKVHELLDNTPYFYPPDPGSKESTIGGNVATNAGGMRAVKYGTTRHYVKELEVVLPTGEVITVGSLNIKDVSGYNLKDLIIGSEGTLGIVTKIKLKVIPEPKYHQSFILAFDNLNEATSTVLKILKTGYVPTALELFDRKTIEYSEEFTKASFPSTKGSAYVLGTFDSQNKEMLDEIMNLIESNYKTKALEIIILNEEEEKTAWKLRDNILYALMEFTVYDMLDEVVPIHKFADMISYTKDLEKKYNTTILNFGHAGDGNIHTLLLKEKQTDEEWIKNRKNILDDLYEKVYKLGGLISAEHGVGYTKRDYFLKHTNDINIHVMRQIKKALDPKNLLNPNKVI